MYFETKNNISKYEKFEISCNTYLASDENLPTLCIHPAIIEGKKDIKYRIYFHHNTYASSGVRWTGSSVNSGGKFARSRSESNLGLNGGCTCFCSSYKNKIKKEEKEQANNKQIITTIQFRTGWKSCFKVQM